ncbi:MAG: HesA/MoeB/ThiF family protein [Cyclobacteriaceae bacterium]|nr:HesA/MoeB/ThiF family protein [Cyclobacteriaceae bacterium SS2]
MDNSGSHASARYQRQTDLKNVGVSGQQKLAGARVLIVGVGGLGCPAAQYLAAAGVGTIGLVDHDKVELSNLQRQILFEENDLGKNKALCAEAKLQKLNSDVKYIVYPEKFSSDNALTIFQDFDLVIDGTDNFETKYLINDASLLADKPMVFGSVYKFEGQLSVFNFQGGPSYRCIFPEHHQLDPNSCIDTGVLGVLPGIVGTLQAAEAIKIILGIGEVYSGKMKIFNALNNQDQIVSFERNEEEINRVLQSGLASSADKDEMACAEEALYIDVRENHELPIVDHIPSIRIPLSELEKRFKEIPRERNVILFCQTGKRSRQALNFLEQKHGYKNLHHLIGGIKELQV